MKTKTITSILAYAIMILAWNISYANPVAGDTCGVPDREGTLTNSTHCAYGLGNPDATDINGYYSDTWTNQGSLVSNGTDSYLSATSDAGWGVIPNSGTWGIASSFWDSFSSAVITIHVGNGNGDPDHWAWLIGTGETEGLWSITKLNPASNGGGLSNIKLWGVRGNTTVPEPGTTALLGLGLLGLFFATRRHKK